MHYQEEIKLKKLNKHRKKRKRKKRNLKKQPNNLKNKLQNKKLPQLFKKKLLSLKLTSIKLFYFRATLEEILKKKAETAAKNVVKKKDPKASVANAAMRAKEERQAKNKNRKNYVDL